MLLGTAAALVLTGMIGVLSGIARGFSLPVAAPHYARGSLDGGLAWFLGGPGYDDLGVFEALFFVAVLLVCRLASRRNLPAYGLLFLVVVAIVSWGRLAAEPWCKAAPAATLIVAALVAGGTCVAIVKEGLLAAAVYSTVAIALDKTPLTLARTLTPASRKELRSGT